MTLAVVKCALNRYEQGYSADITPRRNLRKTPLTPRQTNMPKTKQILIRVSEDEHQELAKKASVAGVSIPSLLREQAGHVKPSKHSNYNWLQTILVARISVQLDRMAEQLSTQNDHLTALDIMARLLSIERELEAWNQKRSA